MVGVAVVVGVGVGVADEEAMFNLHCPDGPPELRENYGFKQSDFSAIIDALSAALTLLCQEWSKIHGAK